MAHIPVLRIRQPRARPRGGNACSCWTYLRIVRRANPAPVGPAGADAELYTAYTSADGVSWARSGTWMHSLASLASSRGAQVRIELVAMANGSGTPFTAHFDYVRVSAVATTATTAP